jgi:transglutaminase-like putative cysteine protease
VTKRLTELLGNMSCIPVAYNLIREGNIMKRSLLMLLLILFSFVSFTYGQSEPIQWGKIPRNDLKMHTYKPDSSASAVVLCNYGITTYNRMYLVTKHHVRIKILKKSGYKWATIKIPYYADANTEEVKHINGATYYLNAKGKIITTKLNHKDIYDEKIDNKWQEIKFTLPRLKPGCVIEFSYDLVSDDPVLLNDWSFQTGIPTRWSEYRFQIPSIFKYLHIYSGWILPSINTVESDEEAGYIAFGPGTNIGQIAINKYRWVVNNAPAVRKEPYMTTTDDYIAKIRFQLSSFQLPYSKPQVVLGTWKKVAEGLLKDSDFGRALIGQRDTRNLARHLTDTLSDNMGKMKLLYHYIQQHITWNGKNGIYIENKPDKVLDKKSGNDADLSIMLTYMLREVGIDANPVILSTRDNGRVITQYPLAAQFNRVITQCTIGGTQYLLDPTDPNRPYSLLDASDLNGNGLIVTKDPKFVPIKSTLGSIDTDYIKATMDKNGKLTGIVNIKFNGQSEVSLRNYMEEQSDKNKYIRNNILKAFAGGSLDDLRVINKDDISKPLQVKAYFKDADLAQVTGNMRYIKLMLTGGYTSNPFKRKKRLLPVDFNYPIKKTYILNLTIPDGFEFRDLPKSTIIKLPGNSAYFKRLIQVNRNMLTVYAQLSINKLHFVPKEYKYLRKFFGKIVSTENDLLVLKKTGT